MKYCSLRTAFRQLVIQNENAIATRPDEKGMLSACANLQDVQDVQVHRRMV